MPAMNHPKRIPTLWQPAMLAACLSLSISATSARAEIDASAQALAKSVADKLAAAQTIKLTAKHTLDPRLGVGAGHERGPIEITVQRPNRFHAIQTAGAETREIAFDGSTLCVMHPELKHHALEPLKAASVDEFADRVDEKFGFRPPVAELLSADVAAQLMRHVTSAKVIGTEMVGWTRCDQLHFEQDGMAGDLWVAKKDGLPRRYRLTFTSISGHPAWDIRLTNWSLNAPVNEALFTKRPAADSQKAPMLKSR